MFYFNPIQFNMNNLFSFGYNLGNYFGSAFWGNFFNFNNYSYQTNPFNSSSLFMMPNFSNFGAFDTFTYSSAGMYNMAGYVPTYSGWNTVPSGNFTPNWNFSPNFSSGGSSGVNNNFRSKSSVLGTRIIENAEYYLGKVNSDATGNRLFSGGVSQAWCADFVTVVMKKSLGDKFPSDFGTAKRGGANYGSSSVFGLKYWAQDNNCYMNLPNSNRGSYISANVKPGDIMIETGHTGIVTKVFSDGSFETVEGNYDNKVARVRHSANEQKVVGFISMAKYA